ncbi:Protein RRP5-like protein, partial [Stegodyphus mimosarum]
MKIKEFDPGNSVYENIQSQDEAETLVTTYPNSSKAWLLYMVYCLKHAEVNKARAVAKRALQTINFREDKEKLNIWKALLNLELHYGTDESVDNAFKEALVYNDQGVIYNHMVDAYISLEKTEDLVKLSNVILKKLKSDKEVWIKFMTYYMKIGKQNEARNFLSRSLQSVPNKEHSDILGKFAHLEYKHGNLERSLSMFEDILIKYPKRKDLRMIYVQVLKQQG